MPNNPNPNPFSTLPPLPRDMRLAEDGTLLSPFSVIFDPGDSRRPVEDPTVFPYEDIALVHAFNDQRRLCNLGTAFYFAPGVAVSAAHVVQHPEAFRHQRGFRANYLWLWFGYSYGRTTGVFVEARDFIVHPAYDASTGTGADVVTIRLPEEFPRRDRERRLTGIGPADTEYRLTGFPGEGPAGGRTMMEGSSQVAAVLGDRLLHQIDATEGQSGAPVWSMDGSEVRIAAIHNEGTSASFNAGFLANGAVLFTADLGDWIAAQW